MWLRFASCWMIDTGLRAAIGDGRTPLGLFLFK
jgi:hypothetical protein